ncbi:hypothetical protein [Fusobacterium polymorphum]|jgi:hypothetical protein|uniref:Uncharacterized protein n=2 Tax=Fusobacterium TaxID=848 RepID=A0A3P1VKT6_FUSNU|nr:MULTISPECIES: hypothetical protein [Fusobacterium]PHH99505.1 hypothetical protein CA836_07375 [Fusobacterium polymorphum]PHI06927.1 hypothetical protein CBG54_07725 [Fusobacterium polymorphum]PHI13250.1 hypothetical protein CBG59_05820 [Fusobacterium polymorphum]RRD34882.1 hypothetical protein EII28_11000 [Fusobacterium nucleatum]WRL70096.1 hypothetical protein VKN81_08085 [Fusobacterium polymorphum]
MKNLKIILKYLWYLFIFSIVVSVIIVMYKNMGLISKFDFGAGAYYYTDIPNFEKYINNSIFKTKFSIWFLITLFLIWGVFVYKLWCYIDRKIEKDK